MNNIHFYLKKEIFLIFGIETKKLELTEQLKILYLIVDLRIVQLDLSLDLLYYKVKLYHQIHHL